MSFCLKSFTGKENYVEVTVESRYNAEFYVVQVCPVIDESRAGHPFIERIYPLYEKERAMAAYERYLKRYCI